ncbi:MAG: hypothetical protein ACLUI3_16740 [Christensenellales bacterium]
METVVAKPSMLAAAVLVRNGAAPGIDGGLNEHVGDGEHVALQTGGDAEAESD